jgi:hypothetical protein
MGLAWLGGGRVGQECVWGRLSQAWVCVQACSLLPGPPLKLLPRCSRLPAGTKLLMLSHSAFDLTN